MRNKNDVQYCMNLLKVIAILLVFNSHCDVLYPEKIRFLATGGAMGNALFFAMCGYFLKFDTCFTRFIYKKIKRLYPFTLIIAVLYVIFDKKMSMSLSECVQIFIWPTFLWFIGALIIFYILSYFLFRYKVLEHFAVYSVIIVILYFLYYFILVDRTNWSVEAVGITSIAGLFKLIYYFYIFTLGYFMKERQCKLPIKKSISCILSFEIFVFSLFFKLLLQQGIISMNWQFVCQIMGVFVVVLAIDSAQKYESLYKINSKWILPVINFISSYSLQINLVQLIIIHRFTLIIFPLNIVCAFLLTIYFSFVIQKFLDYIKKNI